ncbi:DUF3883 domain-containing protein [Streptomyces sp. IMTB 1903]|uniref:DUF3883 domain-containing protein n=1 Tax=Streptomyces sp. IMTB 1903 TaxID=1776680 RepID=UPI00131DD240|nr:DUF3883 domain-containing protein [Streptomyces sp. IMTB 1903]
MADVAILVEILVQIGLVEINESWLRPTKSGVRVATQDHQLGGRLLGEMLIQSGIFAGQIRRLLEVSEIGATGSLVCSRDLAVGVAPQLTGILRRFSTVSFTDKLRVDATVVSKLDGVWSLLPAMVGPELDFKKDMGNRGELYSYQYCRMAATDGAKVRWVARDDETLGYDIEDLNHSPKRRIEVKASGEDKVRFFLSRNEWNVARQLGDAYEVHFWGGVSLKMEVKEEFAKLTGRGYPLIFRGLSSLLDSAVLSAVPTQYLVTRPDGS